MVSDPDQFNPGDPECMDTDPPENGIKIQMIEKFMKYAS